MRLGKIKIFFLAPILFLVSSQALFSADKIESVPLINLEELSPTFEEEKDELEKKDEQNGILQIEENFGCKKGSPRPISFVSEIG